MPRKSTEFSFEVAAIHIYILPAYTRTVYIRCKIRAARVPHVRYIVIRVLVVVFDYCFPSRRAVSLCVLAYLIDFFLSFVVRAVAGCRHVTEEPGSRGATSRKGKQRVKVPDRLTYN